MENLTPKQRWMGRVEALVIAEVPELAGKMDWPTATFLFNEGLGTTETARRLIEAHKRKTEPKEPKP